MRPEFANISYNEFDLEYKIGVAVRRERRLKEMKIKTLADDIGVSVQQVTKYERGKNRIPASTLYFIAISIGVELDRLYEDVILDPRHELDTVDIRRTEKLLFEFLSHCSEIRNVETLYGMLHIMRSLTDLSLVANVRLDNVDGGKLKVRGRKHSGK